MSSLELSPEQQTILDPQIRVVEAGPGSGKTRALVARFIDSASSRAGGIAMLSYTNSAIDEVRKRSITSPNIIKAPNFVGTIDSFLHHFIVTPSEVSRIHRLPNYLQSWDDLPFDRRYVRLRQVPGSGVRLSSFVPDVSGEFTPIIGNLRHDDELYLRLVNAAGLNGQLSNLVKAIANGYVSRGTFDSSSARRRAYEILSGPNSEAVLARVTTRFVEVLVDEAQDCDVAEMRVIRKLAERIKSVVIADPDQAIYEFRGGNPQLFREYRDEQDVQARMELVANYRSSRPICAVVNSLRSVGAATVESVEKSSGMPIYVLSGDPMKQRNKFLDILSQSQISISDAIVLAHRRSDAAVITGRNLDLEKSEAVGNCLALACLDLSPTQGAPKRRLNAISEIERLILRMLSWPDELVIASRDEKLIAINRSTVWLRQSAGSMVASIAHVGDRKEFAAQARRVLTEILSPLPMGHRNLSTQLKAPTELVWTHCVAERTHHDNALTFETIHGAKGCEYKAVLLALPSILKRTLGKDVLDDWNGTNTTEPRRVLYVGASRARKLLAIGAGPHSDRVSKILQDVGIIFTRI
jgi:DNA helicase-2/ATP-dependent DNA helicase PcrA